MKDLTSTSFGILIGFVVPGMMGLLAVAYWLHPARAAFASFATSSSTFGITLLVLLISVGIGVQLSVIRWIVFERIVCRSPGIPDNYFKLLIDEGRRSAFRSVVDEHYRYHQFHGAMVIVFPVLYFGWGMEIFGVSTQALFASALACLAVWAALFFGAVDSYRKYVTRGRHMLRGGLHDERNEPEGKGKES